MRRSDTVPVRRRPDGFTLVELLIVVTMLVTLSAVLAPMLLPSPARTLRAAAGEVATALRETRRQAQAEHRPRRFTVDVDAGRFGPEGAHRPRTLPAQVQVALTTADTLVDSDTRGGIDFYPDGSSSGGRVSLGLAEHVVQVDIEWLTGRVRVSTVQP